MTPEEQVRLATLKQEFALCVRMQMMRALAPEDVQLILTALDQPRTLLAEAEHRRTTLRADGPERRRTNRMIWGLDGVTRVIWGLYA